MGKEEGKITIVLKNDIFLCLKEAKDSAEKDGRKKC